MPLAPLISVNLFSEINKFLFRCSKKKKFRYCPIKAVGPLFKNPEAAGKGSGAVKGDFMKADDSIIGWLDDKEAASVVYISFGSVVYLKQEQVDEIAEGILRAGVSFLWVMKPPHKDSGFELLVLPEGFLEKAGNY